MKIRQDYVTNSSSSSFIICFARIENEEKAKSVLEKHNGRISVYSGEEVLHHVKRGRNSWSNWLEYDWAGIDVTPSEDYIMQHLDSRYVVTRDYDDLYADEDGEVDYDVCYEDFDTSVIDDITEENGFTDINCDFGAGYNG